MQSLRIPARYYRLFSEAKPYGCRESDFHYVEEELDIPIEEAALVLVDCWNMHYCVTYLDRASEVIESKIVPVVKVARGVGMPVVHAPSSSVAEKYPQSRKYLEAGDEEVSPRCATVDPEWPPGDFIGRAGKYESLKRVFSPPRETWKEQYKDMTIAEPLTPQSDDYVVISGNQLHRILKARRILHLFYAGFATNMCLQHRDYGIRAMAERGYNPILIRDCTTALEAHDTVQDLLATKVFMWEIEHKYGFSTSSEQFIEACGSIGAHG